MVGSKIFLWIAIVSSSVMLFGYTIWNLIVVAKELAKIAREAESEIEKQGG